MTLVSTKMKLLPGESGWHVLNNHQHTEFDESGKKEAGVTDCDFKDKSRSLKDVI